MSELVRIEAQGLLFDMDGVLISSIGSVVRSWRTWAKKYGVPDADSYVIPHGMRAIEIIKTLRPDIDPQVGLREIEDLELEDTADLVVLPGARELLESLPADRWTIVTSATRRLMLGRLEVAGLPVPERIVSADDVQRGKPDPEPYRKGAELLGFRPQDCVVIEDAPSGIGAGKAAGARVLGVIGTHTLEELHEADWAVRSLTAVSAKVGGDVLELEFQAE